MTPHQEGHTQGLTHQDAMNPETCIPLAEQLVQFVPVVVGLFFALIFFFVAIRLLLRSHWETDRQPFLTGILFIFLGCWAASGTAGLSSSLCEMTGLMLFGGALWYARWLFQEWYRGFPVIGQKWDVLGLGEVEVTGIFPELSPDGTISDRAVNSIVGKLSESPLDARVQFKVGDDEPLREISVLQFRFKATLVESKPKGRR